MNDSHLDAHRRDPRRVAYSLSDEPTAFRYTIGFRSFKARQSRVALSGRSTLDGRNSVARLSLRGVPGGQGAAQIIRRRRSG